MNEFLNNEVLNIILAIVTAVASFIGVTVKNAYIKYADTKTKKEIVKSTVEYVEQVCKTLEISSENKFNKAKQKALEWLSEKGLKISDTELEILIESAVNGFKKGNKEGK